MPPLCCLTFIASVKYNIKVNQPIKQYEPVDRMVIGEGYQSTAVGSGLPRGAKDDAVCRIIMGVAFTTGAPCLSIDYLGAE